MRQGNYLRLEIEILDIRCRQWNGSEDIDITNVSKILLKFDIVCHCLLTIFTGQRNFFDVLQTGYLTEL